MENEFQTGSPLDIYTRAEQAEATGIPVAWKQIAATFLNVLATLPPPAQVEQVIDYSEPPADETYHECYNDGSAEPSE
jgi:hypothetical protein